MRHSGEHRQVMPRIVDRLATAERSRMSSDDPPVLADHDAVGIGMDFDRTPDGIGGHGVFVAVEAHQASLDTAAGTRVEAVEPARITNKLRPLRLEHSRLSVRSAPDGDAPWRRRRIYRAAKRYLVVGLNRRRGVKNRSRTNPTWFST